MKELDLDYTKIRSEIKKKFPDKDFTYMLDYLNLERLSYGSSNTNIKESFIESNKFFNNNYPILVTGSFYVVGEFRNYLNIFYTY